MRTDNTMATRKVQKDKQRSTKHTYKTKDRVTRTPLKTGGELRRSGRVSSSYSISGTCRVNLKLQYIMYIWLPVNEKRCGQLPVSGKE